MMLEPSFWAVGSPPPPLWKHLLLKGLSWIYIQGGRLKNFFTLTLTVSKPVICVGNILVGGAGKTPTTLSIARHLKAQGMNPAIISRGYKGSLRGPLKVEPQRHTAKEVGDEPLLLAASMPTWISANRYRGAKAAIAAGADIIVLDDGLQNKTLKQDFKICVVNTKQVFGNGQIFPLGPLRESIQEGLARMDAVLLPLPPDMPLIKADIGIDKEDWVLLREKPLVAFAGLAQPGKFFDTLRVEGFTVKATVPFSDHHDYTDLELSMLQQLAKDHKASLVTTQKDWVRLPKERQKDIFHLRITLEYHDGHQLRRLLKPLVEGKKKK
jgi:tetraacyldisaccharide 4'-kinase